MELLLEKWNDILSFVKEEHDLTDMSFDIWLRPLEVYSVEENTVYILVSNEQQTDKMRLDYISKKYYLPLKAAIAEITGIPYEITFIMSSQKKTLKPVKESFRKQPSLSESASFLNPNYTFDTFVVGSNNRFAHSASLAVAESPGEAYNPLYIYGGPGLGKTHLIQSIGHFLLDNDPSLKVIYVTSEAFTNEVIETIRNGNAAKLSNMRNKYRTADVLMIDDIQFIIGKESTQDEFFHTFNALQSLGKQIIITSDKPPKDMVTLEERIRSRLEWGLMADIGTPDYETRMAILRKKAETDHFVIADEILDYIAVNIKSNIRELEGALNKLHAYHRMENCEITMMIAEAELHSIITPDQRKEPTCQLIIEVVCEHFHISPEQMISKNRSANISHPRQIAMYLCNELTSDTYKSIGNYLGGKDHATVLHGIKKIRDEMESDAELRGIVETIRRKIIPN